MIRGTTPGLRVWRKKRRLYCTPGTNIKKKKKKGSRKEWEGMPCEVSSWGPLRYVKLQRDMCLATCLGQPTGGERRSEIHQLVSSHAPHLTGWSSPHRELSSLPFRGHLPVPFAPAWEAGPHVSGTMSHPGPEVAGGAWPPASRHRLEESHGPAGNPSAMAVAETANGWRPRIK